MLTHPFGRPRRSRPESLRSTANRDLVDDIRRIHRDTNGRYGNPRIHAELRAQGRGAIESARTYINVTSRGIADDAVAQTPVLFDANVNDLARPFSSSGRSTRQTEYADDFWAAPRGVL
ncbi:MAG: transposase [Bradyrhizobium sp.]|nr:transposase [Bradyrhizobium sp.]